MKKIIYLFVLTFLLFSCSSDDNDNVTGSIIGSWKPVKTVIVGTATSNGINIPINQTIVSNECQLKSRTIFGTDGIVKATSWDDTSGTCQQISSESSAYTYNSSTKTLSMTQNGIQLASKVSKLTDTELITEDNLNNLSLPDLGNNITFTGKITTYSTKEN